MTSRKGWSYGQKELGKRKESLVNVPLKSPPLFHKCVESTGTRESFVDVAWDQNRWEERKGLSGLGSFASDEGPVANMLIWF